tara:strand:+ start:513 stop:1010 length:498 start_codon:yes stop_codon:yes gene_type:complete
MSRVHKKSRVYNPSNHFNGWIYRGYLICYGAEVIDQEQLLGIGECDTDWFRSDEPWDGFNVDDVKFDCRTGGWATINCIMDNVDDKIDEIPMDEFDGVDWMVSFRRGNGYGDGIHGAVKITVPHWHVKEAREWVMERTGHYVSSMTRVFMGEQPRIIKREGEYKY